MMIHGMKDKLTVSYHYEDEGVGGNYKDCFILKVPKGITFLNFYPILYARST